MNGERLHSETDERNTDQSDKNNGLRTSDVYRVKENLPQRFNNPDCFKGYSTKRIHPLYQTTNQIYGSMQPTIHEMPTSFHGSQRKYSDQSLKCGMFRDNGFNTSLEKNRITGPNTINVMEDRLIFHRLFNSTGSNRQSLT